MEFECSNCIGEQPKTHYSYYECDNCHEPIRPVEAAPADELRELVETWRDRELHPQATEKERVLWGSAINEIGELLDD